MDQRPRPSDIPDELLAIIEQNWQWLCEQWDLKYPDNPVAMAEDADDGGEDDPPDAE
ncbi:MAG: hypothetical protein HYX69_22415 [Planctomycetia bacterium]|nr:hypothetical protein [Planctomycetia bacterium]